MSIPNNEIWREFFQFYKELPELWQVKSAIFKDKNKKKRAMEKLLEKYREIEPNSNIDSLRKRLNNIKTCYRRELKKVEKSEKSGAGLDEQYVSSLWYFKDLEFLRDQETQISGLSTIGLENEDELVEEGEEATETENVVRIRECHKKRRTIGQQLAEKNSLLKDAVECMKQKEYRDEASIYAEGWATSFRKLSPTQKIFAKRAIDEILVLGQLEQLTLHSVQVPSSSSSNKSTPNIQYSLSSSPFDKNIRIPSTSTSQNQSLIISPETPFISSQSSNFISINDTENYSNIQELLLDSQYK